MYIKLKIVILDHPRENKGEIDWSALDRFDVTRYDTTRPEEAADKIGDADAVMLNKTILDERTLAACPRLKFISVIATGYNTVDVKAAKKLGIKVSNVPSYGSEAIAQHAFALLLELTDRVAHHDSEVRKMRRSSGTDWCFWDYPVMELAHKKMGVIGLGHIGQITARIAQAFGMEVIAYDIARPLPESVSFRYSDLDALLRESDVIALHCPLTAETENIIDRRAISMMKPGAILINNSRGALVDEQALAEALNDGRLAGAGIDTVRVEPITENNPLLTAENCVITPHISWAALECRQRLVDTAVNNLLDFIEGRPRNIVN